MPRLADRATWRVTAPGSRTPPKVDPHDTTNRATLMLTST